MILGQVVTGDSGTPVRRAQVNLTGQELRGQRTTLTDDEGRFVFTLLPAGRYNVNTSKAGYVNIAYGAKAPGRAGTRFNWPTARSSKPRRFRCPGAAWSPASCWMNTVNRRQAHPCGRCGK